MTELIRKYNLIDTHVYLDDIITGAITPEELDERHKRFMECCSQNSITLNEDKCLPT